MFNNIFKMLTFVQVYLLFANAALASDQSKRPGEDIDANSAQLKRPHIDSEGGDIESNNNGQNHLKVMQQARASENAAWNKEHGFFPSISLDSNVVFNHIILPHLALKDLRSLAFSCKSTYVFVQPHMERLHEVAIRLREKIENGEIETSTNQDLKLSVRFKLIRIAIDFEQGQHSEQTLQQKIVEIAKPMPQVVNFSSLFVFSKSTLRRLDHINFLDLRGNELESVPEFLGQLKCLKYLKLSRNKITSLPSSVGQLVNLVELFVDDNQLEELPQSLGQLVKLRYLRLANNKLTSLPDSLSGAERLQELSLTNNQLTVLPRSLGQLRYLAVLSLGGNQIRSLPACFNNPTLIIHRFTGTFDPE